jgi:MFS family permease
LNRDVRLICISNFVFAFGDGLFVYVLPNIIRGLQATPAEVGVAFAIFSVGSIITPIPGGFLADKYDRKKVIILGCLVWLPVPVLFSLASYWTQMLPSMFLYGFFLSGPATSAYIASTVKREEMARAFTATSASYWIGYTFSPSIGAYIAQQISISVVFYLTTIFYALATIVLVFLGSQYATKELSTAKEKEKDDTYSIRSVLIWSLFLTMLVFSILLTRPLIPQFLADVYKYSDFHIGIIGSVTFAGATLWCLLLGRLGDRWRKSGAISIGLGVSVIATLVLLLTDNFAMLLLSAFLMGASYTLWSLMGAIIGPLAPPTTRGRWISVSHTAATTASFAASLAGGILYEIKPSTPFLIFIVTAAILALLGFISKMKE